MPSLPMPPLLLPHLSLLPLLLLLVSSPTLTSSSLAPVPWLGLFSDPSSATPGQPVRLSWLCFFCPPFPASSSVTLSTNGTAISPSPFLTSGAINGSSWYTVPLTLSPSSSLTLTASLPPLPPSSLTIPLHSPSPSLTLTRPSRSDTVSQRTGLPLQWACSECYELSTVSIAWEGGSSGRKGVLVSGMKTTQSGWVMPLPKEMMEEDTVQLTISTDQEPHLTSSTMFHIAQA